MYKSFRRLQKAGVPKNRDSDLWPTYLLGPPRKRTHCIYAGNPGGPERKSIRSLERLMPLNIYPSHVEGCHNKDPFLGFPIFV